LVIGAGANRKMTSNMLRQFVDATGMPFCGTQMGKGVIDESAQPCLPSLAARKYLKPCACKNLFAFCYCTCAMCLHWDGMPWCLMQCSRFTKNGTARTQCCILRVNDDNSHSVQGILGGWEQQQSVIVIMSMSASTMLTSS
jgi:hypothetical protein